jgi:hypothetical protein
LASGRDTRAAWGRAAIGLAIKIHPSDEAPIEAHRPIGFV